MIDRQLAQAGIRAKIERARNQVEELDTQMSSFTDTHPYAVDRYDKGDQVVGSIRFTKPLPVMWSVVLGEILHNIRSAMEHTVYLLACAHSGRHVASTGFPVFTNADDYGKKGVPQVRHLPDEARTFIESLQPFASNTALTKSIRTAHTLWTQDKHRVVQPWAYLVMWDRASLGFIPHPIEFLKTRSVLHDNAKVFSARFLPGIDVSKVSVQGNLTLHVAFDDPTDDSGDHFEFVDMVDGCANVVESLLRMLPA